MRLPSALLGPSSKNKENPPRENFIYFGEMELSSSNIKKFLIFSQKTAYLMFQEMEFLGPSSKFLIYQEMGLSNSKIKKCLLFPEREPCTF